MNSSERILFNKHLVDTFKRAINILDDNGIQWFASSGTTIGAIRHNGIIPWDDDIDIYIHRRDFDKLTSLAYLFEKNGLQIESIMNKGYTHSYVKIIDKNTTVVENLREGLSGLWIDVFVLDQIDGGLLKYKRIYPSVKHQFEKYQNGLLPIPIKSLIYSLVTFKWNTFFKYLFSLTYYKNTAEKQKTAYLELIKRNSVAQGSNLVCFSESAPFVYNPKWFSSYVDVPFEDFTIRVPVGYDDYLNEIYGDYMTPPNPIPEYSHFMYYVNLNERISLEEAKKRVKKGIHFEY